MLSFAPLDFPKTIYAMVLWTPILSHVDPIVLYEPRVEPLIPARFGDFLEVRPGSRFDHKGSNRFGRRNSSQKSKLPSKNRIELSPSRIHILFIMGLYGEHKFMDSTCPELIKKCALF